jgi:uncharacterized protein YjbI with pentapeptide repeats
VKRFGIGTRLFVSYSRNDESRASAVAASLTNRGFRVFIDKAEMDPGENFVTRLTKEIRQASGIVALISESYVTSRWAQAELYHATALRKTIVPIVDGPELPARLDAPLARLIRDSHWVTMSADQPDPRSSDFGRLLGRARRRHLTKLAVRVGLAMIAVLALTASALWTVANLNSLDVASRRRQIISEIQRSTNALGAQRIAAFSAGLTGDPVALGEVLALQVDRSQPAAARFNALALAGQLLKDHTSPRWYIEELDVPGATLENVTLFNTTFRGGNWTNATIRRSVLSSVAWTSAPMVRMSGILFDGVEFHSVLMQPFVAVDVTFRNSKFRGGEVNISSFSKVRFVTEHASEPDSNPIITPDFALFERSVILSQHEPPEPGVLDLSTPSDYTVFDGVVFVDCKLEGWFDPAWFRNSSFENCSLPPSLTIQALQQFGNNVT